MKLYTLLLFWTTLCIGAQAQDHPLFVDTGTFVLHKFQQAIGKETYTTLRKGDELAFKVDFAFTDRSSRVALKATLTTTPHLDPLSLRIQGKTSRITQINDSITLNGQTARVKINDSTYSTTTGPLVFPVTGYAPCTFQMLLLRYWNDRGRPENLPLLPTGSVKITRDGVDTLTLDGRTVFLDRYVVAGLIWGNELIWMDAEGRLACLVTIDAELDKFEATLPIYEPLLPVLLEKAAQYGMRLFVHAGGAQAQPYPFLAITGGTLIDVAEGRSIPNATVLIRSGRVERAGPADGISIPSEYHVIHAEGKTILPGLWDMHAHFEQVEWGPAYLGAGVTTVRDCGNEFAFINAVQRSIDQGAGIGPHILKAGIIDGKGSMSLGIIQADDAAEAIAAVDRYKAGGFVQIKIYSSVKPAVVKAICTEAHRLDLTVTGHIPDGMNLIQGVDSGMDMVNHIQYVLDVLKKGSNQSIDFSDAKNVEVLRFLKDHHIVVDPTLGVFEMIFRSLADSVSAIEPNFYTLPSPLQSVFVNEGMNPKQAAFYKPYFQSCLDAVKHLHENGIPIVAGTDEGFPGYSVYRELELYVRAGLTPMEALQTATIVPARVMKREAVSGSVSPGKGADLILVDGNPLEDIRNIRKVSTVIKDGVVYDPVAMHRLVGFNL
jgi:hypothetical protein